jgi:hypothetical protein
MRDNQQDKKNEEVNEVPTTVIKIIQKPSQVVNQKRLKDKELD